jgi:hypothetical protein
METRILLESLMAGDFICPVTNDEAFQYLSQSQGVDKINAAMTPFDREVAQLPDNGAFYLVTKDFNNKSDKHKIRKNFEECRDLIEPVVSFMVLVSRVNPNTGLLSTGHTIRFTELLSTIASNEHHIQQLNQLMTLKLFKTTKQGTDEKLRAIFKGMLDIGLLVEKNTEEMIFQATGKLDYFHHIMQFIADHERIDIIEGNEDQTEFSV